ncbi:MAG: hypothetical protein KA007_02120 [Candidatus Pacebacteria bacterium]|jgi:hypothetical protein|nr:hypothetical protein [Candidatus Paceibacterota bacterium]
MNFLNKKIFITLILTAVLLFLHVGAIKFGWYYLFYEFDMLPHFLGGLVVFLIIYNFALIFEKEIKISKILLLVFFVTIGWEFFEIYLDNTFGVEYARTFDSVSDIFLGMAGATIGAFFTAKINKNIYNNINGK